MSWQQSRAALTLLLIVLGVPAHAVAEDVDSRVDAITGAPSPLAMPPVGPQADLTPTPLELETPTPPELEVGARSPERVPQDEPRGSEPANPSGGSASFAPGRVLVVPLTKSEVAEVLAIRASQAIATVVSAQGDGWSAITREELDDLLDMEQAQQLLGCESDAACLATASRSAEPSWVVSGTIGMVGLNLTVNLVLVDVEASVVRNRVSEVILRNDSLASDVRALTRRLFAWTLAHDSSEPRFELSGDRERSFAVFDLTPSGVEAAVAENLTQVLADELKNLENARVVGRDDIRNMLSLMGDKQQLGCADDDACLVEIGGALGVSYLVAGTVGKIADTFIIALRLTNPREGTVENRVTESFTGRGEQILGAMRVAIWRLIGIPRSGPGDLLLSANLPAAVYLDGAAVGSLPLSALVGLTPGRHSLRLEAEDFQEWQSDIYVEPGRETAIRARLLPLPREWYESWVFWTIAGGVAAIAAGTTIAVIATTGGNSGDPQGTTFAGMEISLPAR